MHLHVLRTKVAVDGLGGRVRKIVIGLGRGRVLRNLRLVRRRRIASGEWREGVAVLPVRGG